MSKSKLILSILLLLALVGIGIILPYIWKHNHQKSASSSAVSEKHSVQKSSAAPQFTYKGFDELEIFLPESVVADLRELFSTYLIASEIYDDITITFLPDATSYPSEDSTELTFQLSNDSALPVIYLSDGSFLFGEEKMKLVPENTIYDKPDNPDLPNLTSEEIEARQEGGIPDTKEGQQ